MKLSKNFRAFAVSAAVLAGIYGLFTIPAVSAAVLGGFQGGTGIGTGTSTDVGKNLQVASTTPFLTYVFAPGASGITSLNGSTSSTQTFSAGSGISISTNSGVHTFTNTIVPNYVSSTIAGAGISVSGATGAVTITNSVVPNYVSSTIAGQNIAVSGATGAVTISAPLVFNTSGSGINISSSSPTYTFSNTGVTSITAGSSTIVSAATGVVNVGVRPYSCQWVANYSTSSTVWNDDFCIYDSTSTISSVWAKVQTPGDSVTFNIYYSNTLPAATTTGAAFLGKLFTTDQVLTSTSTTQLTVNGSSTPRLGDFLRIVAYNASSSELTARIFYNE